MPKRKQTSANPVSMCDMPEEILEHIASSLSPPDAFALVSSSKSIFWNPATRDGSDQPLGVELVQAALRRHLKTTLGDVISQVGDRRAPRSAFTVQDLFPPHLVPKDTNTKPQVLLSGSLAVKAVMGLGVSRTDEHRKDADVDIFCTWEAAPFVRQRLVERCGLICTGSDDGSSKLTRS